MRHTRPARAPGGGLINPLLADLDDVPAEVPLEVRDSTKRVDAVPVCARGDAPEIDPSGAAAATPGDEIPHEWIREPHADLRRPRGAAIGVLGMIAVHAAPGVRQQP